jgi:hypothetical protein
MLLTGTLIVLALWLLFVWFCDPDGFRPRRVHNRSCVRKRPESTQTEEVQNVPSVL